jgi:hypothetical protein
MRREFVTDIASERSLLSKREMMGVRSQTKQGYEAQNPTPSRKGWNISPRRG